MPDRDSHYWVGALSMTIAQATTIKDPRPVLKASMTDFLKHRPHDDTLALMLRDTLNQSKGKT